MTHDEFTRVLEYIEACSTAIGWVKHQDPDLSAKQIWGKCHEPAWMLWLWVRFDGPRRAAAKLILGWGEILLADLPEGKPEICRLRSDVQDWVDGGPAPAMALPNSDLSREYYGWDMLQRLTALCHESGHVAANRAADLVNDLVIDLADTIKGGFAASLSEWASTVVEQLDWGVIETELRGELARLVSCDDPSLLSWEDPETELLDESERLEGEEP